MKGGQVFRQAEQVERLGELARLEGQLHEDWQADYSKMSAEDVAEARAAAQDLIPKNLDTDDADYVRAWEEYQATRAASSDPASMMKQVSSREYRFHPNNPFLESANPYQEAVALYGAGRLNEAVLAFEAALKQNPHDSNCWRLLGTCYAENDDDGGAIVPLLRAVAEDPSNLEALLELGVSFTNELEEDQALHFLHSWLLYHPDFKHVPGDQPVDREHITSMFVRASEFVPKDPDVWTVLGVLYNLSRQYDLAEQAFERACALDSTNYSLYNKLGATQANSPSPDGSVRAVAAYRRALELKPNYVRSWANMGISYANQTKYKSAVKYYLKALSLNESAEHIWGYLRFAFACMNRQDLLAKTDARNLELFKDEFRF